MQVTRGNLAGLSGLCAAMLIALVSLTSIDCNDGGAAPPTVTGGSGGGGQADAGGTGGSGLTVTPVTVSAETAARTARTTTWSVNYWQWSPTFGNQIPGTEAEVAAVTPKYLRVGGYNNDANTPDTFDNAQLDTMVTYARAIGAEPILQVPHLAADKSGTPATPANAAAMVQYANVTKSYGIKYFSVGNEPDLYDSSGLPSDSTMPAIPNYTPAQYCASVTAYVAAMKAVDPTIKIVGPDLAWKYIAGGDTSIDWLTPILQMCGNQFDVIAIHRYPFESKMATLSAAAADPVTFRQVMTSVLGILQTTGQGAKPLALTEMNVAYDNTTCVLGATPGTVGSALWMADILGSAVELNLWTSAVWNISDTADWSLGLIGLPPGHVARPSYYAYALYAAHFGPTLLPAVNGLPAGVSAYATRNSGDDTTALIVVNWNAAPVALKLQVTGLAAAPAAPTYRLPGVSMAAIEIQDSGNATAWVYGEDERHAAVGPQPISQGTAPAAGVDGGASATPAGRTVGDNCPAATDAGLACTSFTATSDVITTNGMTHTSPPLMTFGSGTDAWGSYTYAGAGQAMPDASVTNDLNGIHIKGGFVAPIPANYAGVGLYYNSASCLDVTAYTGVQFDFSGTLGGCALALGSLSSGDASQPGNPGRGGCTASTATSCYGPSADVTAQAIAVDGGASTTIKVPFKSLGGGMPISTLDPGTVLTVQWQLTSPGGGACSTDFTVENVKFY